MDTHALPCVKETAGGNFPYDSGNSNRGSATTQRAGVGWKVGGMSKTEGTHVSLWLMHVDVRQKPTQYCKTIILQLKINNFKKGVKKKKMEEGHQSERA